jgi:hypothetical protein
VPLDNRRIASPSFSSLKNRPLILGLAGLLALATFCGAVSFNYLNHVLANPNASQPSPLWAMGVSLMSSHLWSVAISLYIGLVGWRPGLGRFLFTVAGVALLLISIYLPVA